jgi:acetyltransferase
MPRPEAPRTDPSHDLFAQPGLHRLFNPRSVAIIGATETSGSVGRTLLMNLITNPFGGVVYPVHPKRKSVLGIKAYPSVLEVPDAVDLAVIATPSRVVPAVVRQCAEAGVKHAIIITAGFKEIGEEGLALEAEILEIARGSAMRVVGPNCLGVMRPPSGLNATFAGAMATSGNVAFLSQSGALQTAILDWSLREHVGFSAFVSVGSMLDVGWGDLIQHFGSDHRTKSILIYMESIGDAKGFLSAAREVALQKPIIVIKAGRTEEAAKAAASHTGALAGSDDVLSAAFRRTGVVRVDSIADLFYMAEVTGKQPRPKGRRLSIVTNAGGPGVLATDALIQGGGKLAGISSGTMQKLNEALPAAWSHNNPVDVLGDADGQRYVDAVQAVQQDPESDGLLVILTPQDMTEPTQTAELMKRELKNYGKPILASWMGGAEIEAGERILNRAGIPTFAFPDTAARIFNYMSRYSYNLRALYETPALPGDGEADTEAVASLLAEIRATGRTILTETESKRVLAAYGIPIVETRKVKTEDAAVEAAEALGYPVVVKLDSETITHKTDVGGVVLDLPDANAVRAAFRGIQKRVEALAEEKPEKYGSDAFGGVSVQPMLDTREGYELILGASPDPQFGPVLLFGAGGTLVEVFKDRALGLPPLNTTLARRMIEQTKIAHALEGVRGRDPVDMDALEALCVRFSQLVVEHPSIAEIDINPLFASADRLVALDGRVVLYPPEVAEADLPRPAIRPYPRAYVERWETRTGETVTIRPIRPEDEPLLVDFHELLSEKSVYLRYASILKMNQRIAHERLARLCFIDYDREMALVVERTKEGGSPQIIAVGRLIQLPHTRDAEFGMLIADEFQGQGIGTHLLERLIGVGRDENASRIVADILWENKPMQAVCQKLGFALLREDPTDPMVKAVKSLEAS